MKKPAKVFFIALLILFLSSPLAACKETSPTELKRTVSEQRISNLTTLSMENSAPLPIVPKSLRISDDCRRIAYIEKNGNNKMQVIIEDTQGQTRGKEYADIDVNSLTFSPDSKRLAYFASENKGGYFVVVDGAEMKQYAPFGDNLIFSPDSKQVAYVTRIDDFKYKAVVDDIAEKQYETVLGFFLVFSPDSKRLAYVAMTRGGDEWFAVIDGVEQKRYTRVGPIVFSPDSKHVAYAASPVETRDRHFIVIDGIEGKQYDGVDEISFSPDSKRLAYMAVTKISTRNYKMLAVVDGVEGNQYESINPPLFSPDSERVAYTAWEGYNQTFIVVDGIEGEAHYAISGNPVFSPDSKQIAYIYRTVDYKRAVVVDGIEGNFYRSIVRVLFSPDGKHVACVAETNGGWTVVIDGVEGQLYDNIGHNSAYQYVIFDSSNSFHYLAIKKDGIYLVDEKVK
jgi:Tol biopolymer transport system component